MVFSRRFLLRRGDEVVSRLVAVVDEPMPLSEFGPLSERLEREHGPGLRVRAGRWTRFEIRTPGPACWCWVCEEADAVTYQRLTGNMASRFFIVCPECGNKRCPRATHHHQVCSGSNEPGQAGSSYA